MNIVVGIIKKQSKKLYHHHINEGLSFNSSSVGGNAGPAPYILGLPPGHTNRINTMHIMMIWVIFMVS